MKRQLILLAIPALLLTACSSEPAMEVSAHKELEETVLARHDSAMVLMGDIYKMRRNLRTLRDTIEAQQGNTSTLNILARELDGLTYADKVMMDWMHNYQAPDSLQPQEAMTYLQQELQKINRVQTVMDSTIKAAQKTYRTYEQPK